MKTRASRGEDKISRKLTKTANSLKKSLNINIVRDVVGKKLF